MLNPTLNLEHYENILTPKLVTTSSTSFYLTLRQRGEKMLTHNREGVSWFMGRNKYSSSKVVPETAGRKNSMYSMALKLKPHFDIKRFFSDNLYAVPIIFSSGIFSLSGKDLHDLVHKWFYQGEDKLPECLHFTMNPQLAHYYIRQMYLAGNFLTFMSLLMSMSLRGSAHSKIIKKYLHLLDSSNNVMTGVQRKNSFSPFVLEHKANMVKHRDKLNINKKVMLISLLFATLLFGFLSFAGYANVKTSLNFSASLISVLTAGMLFAELISVRYANKLSRELEIISADLPTLKNAFDLQKGEKTLGDIIDSTHPHRFHLSHHLKYLLATPATITAGLFHFANLSALDFHEIFHGEFSDQASDLAVCRPYMDYVQKSHYVIRLISIGATTVAYSALIFANMLYSRLKVEQSKLDLQDVSNCIRDNSFDQKFKEKLQAKLKQFSTFVAEKSKTVLTRALYSLSIAATLGVIADDSVHQWEVSNARYTQFWVGSIVFLFIVSANVREIMRRGDLAKINQDTLSLKHFALALTSAKGSKPTLSSMLIGEQSFFSVDEPKKPGLIDPLEESSDDDDLKVLPIN